jgi:hypothetical protein
VNRLSALLGSFGILVASLSACGGSDLVLPSETGPGEITMILGNNQSGPAGAELLDPLVVKVLDRRGEPLPSQRVAFTLDTDVPGADITPDTAETGSDGMAEARWVLGSTSGTQTAVARVVGASGLEVRFNATVGAAGAARLEVVDGDGQTASVGTALPDPLVVRVADGFGNPVEGVSVTWSAEEGSVSPTSSVTGEDGWASTSWTLGSSSGSQSASAASAGLSGSPVAFTATATAGGADLLVLVSGDDQTGPPGTELQEPLVVRLLDEAGNGIPDRAVSWVVATGGGSVSSGNTNTDAEGRASTRWTLGPNPGPNTLNAVVSGVGVVGFSATATGGGSGGGSDASRLRFRVQPSDTEEDERISPPVQVEVLDQAGNLVTQGQFEITVELIGDGRQGRGRLDGDRRKLTQGGVATFDDLSVERDGDYRLRASADGLPSVDSDQFEVSTDQGD